MLAVFDVQIGEWFRISLLTRGEASVMTMNICRGFYIFI
jgi:hypothetical protein